MNKSVLQDWVCELPFMQQALLCVALRGPDGVQKHCSAKPILRFLRGAVLKPADPKYTGNANSFMWLNYEETIKVKGHPTPQLFKTWENSVFHFFDDVDFYPHHFLMHLFHAAQVVGFQHPDHKIKTYWKNFYDKAVHSLHMNPETFLQMDDRIGHIKEK